VLYKLLFDGQMINALTDAGLRIDIWLHADAAHARSSQSQGAARP
jgi:hypothetical protein